MYHTSVRNVIENTEEGGQALFAGNNFRARMPGGQCEAAIDAHQLIRRGLTKLQYHIVLWWPFHSASITSTRYACPDKVACASIC